VVDRALELWGAVDVLVNNAAYINDQSGALLQTDLDQWDRQFAITVTGTFLMTKLCVPEMIKRGGGSIVNISSIGGINPFGEGTAYCTAKAAVLQFTRSVAIDYGLKGIRCNVVCPGDRHAHLWQYQEARTVGRSRSSNGFGENWTT
jgi:NAD(P)-dependent dehydrogenase (short-subunit alcohol dehydrogenase family)